MNPLLLFFASGESLYPGAALLLILISISTRLRSRWTHLTRNVLAWTALSLIVMASPPLPWTIQVAFLVTFFAWYAFQNARVPRPVIQRTLAAALVVFVVVLSSLEFPHRVMPQITGQPSSDIVVIGDSISAGLGTASAAWPSVFQKITGVGVKNLSRVGATTNDAVTLAARLTPEDKLVLIEIGGNDLILGRSATEFAGALARLLSLVAAPGRTVVMFELPLIPNQIEYGRIQRRLAKQYGVWLIPKRFLVQVIRGSDATIDGLHLTGAGAGRMADLVARALSPVLKPSVNH